MAFPETTNTAQNYVTDSDVCEDVVLERLDEPQEDVVLFDVPNPESDIDPDVTEADSARVFNENLRQLRALAASVTSAAA